MLPRAVDGHELRTGAATRVTRIAPRVEDERAHPVGLYFADPDSHLEPRILEVVRLRIGVDPALVVKGNTTRAAELRPLGDELSILVENLNPVVGTICHVETRVWAYLDGV